VAARDMFQTDVELLPITCTRSKCWDTQVASKFWISQEISSATNDLRPSGAAAANWEGFIMHWRGNGGWESWWGGS